jgi:prepilin-type N-terminal cleavage/methylation domain-containing protein/prepilin-type processing-associated H-X9-DG protein
MLEKNMKKRNGFTLIELLVVVAIISVLIALLLPALGKARQAAQVSVCQSHVKNIWTATRLYIDSNNGYGPYYYYPTLYPRWWNLVLLNTKYLLDYSLLDCPTAANETTHSYQGRTRGLVYGLNVCLFGCQEFKPKIIDNVERPSEKLMVVEGFNKNIVAGIDSRDNAESPWYILYDNYWGDGTGSSLLTIRHDGDANVAFIDGHVEKGKDKFDAYSGTVWRYWRDDFRPNE